MGSLDADCTARPLTKPQKEGASGSWAHTRLMRDVQYGTQYHGPGKAHEQARLSAAKAAAAYQLLQNSGLSLTATYSKCKSTAAIGKLQTKQPQ